MRPLKFFIGILSLFFCIGKAQAQNPKVELPGTEVIKFHSAIDTQQYVLYINLPENYAKTDKKYPVLYVTDGQWFFNPMYAGYGSQHYDGFVPDLILVGITWADDYSNRRSRDFSPTHVDWMANSGNAPKFLSVIKNEVIKLIDSTYHTDKSDRGIYGTSFGGLFAIYTLFHEPTLFNRYIIISPSLDWDNEILFKYEKSFAEKNRSLNAKVFISTGQHEKTMDFGNSFSRFINQLKGSKYKGLDLDTMVTDRMGHSGSGVVGGVIGLQSVYSRPELKLDAVLLDQYAGRYVTGSDTAVLVRWEDDLYYRAGPGKIKLFAETPQKFYIKGMNGSIQFKEDDKRKVSGYDLMLPDTTMFAKKID